MGRIAREGTLETASGRVLLEQVSVARPGQRVAFVMDTRDCDGARRLAQGADLLVCESTFAGGDAALAAPHQHLTAPQAGAIALESDARQLVLTHFSQRYVDLGPLLEQAREVFPATVLAQDLARVAVPPRRRPR